MRASGWRWRMAVSRRLRLIRGEAGTGKTLVAARLAAVYRRADWQVVGLTPTGAGLDALRDAGLPGGRTLRQFAGPGDRAAAALIRAR